MSQTKVIALELGKFFGLRKPRLFPGTQFFPWPLAFGALGWSVQTRGNMS